MQFLYSPHHFLASERRWQRLFEILPGLTSWGILVGLIGLSILKPILAAILIICFYFYWLLKLLYMTIFLVLSYYRLKMEQQTDWMERIKNVDRLEESLKDLLKDNKDRKIQNILKRLSFAIHQRELLHLKKSGQPPPSSEAIYHLVIYPVAKEPREILEPGIKRLSQQKFPAQRIVVIFALEERAAENIKEDVFALQEKYRHHFFDLLIVIHPTDLPGETRVKGANVTYAAKQAAQYLSDKKISFDQVIASCFDADTVVHSNYFTCLTYYFLVWPQRFQSSFQPIPVYHNNIWDVPGFARVIEIGSSFFQLIEATNPDKLVTFSSHSMSFKALVDVGYWPVDMISDDSAIYWKAFVHYGGRYHVVPLYVTVSMDIAGSKSILETARTVYKQKRRWAWGVYYSLSQKIRHALEWLMIPFILVIFGALPALDAQTRLSLGKYMDFWITDKKRNKK